MKVAELKGKIKNGEDVLLLDVRERDEIAQSGNVIEGSRNIPMGDVLVEAAKGSLPKDRKIVTICRSGSRSGFVARDLVKKGYDAESLDGGMEEWRMLK